MGGSCRSAWSGGVEWGHLGVLAFGRWECEAEKMNPMLSSAILGHIEPVPSLARD